MDCFFKTIQNKTKSYKPNVLICSFNGQVLATVTPPSEQKETAKKIKSFSGNRFYWRHNLSNQREMGCNAAILSDICAVIWNALDKSKLSTVLYPSCLDATQNEMGVSSINRLI